ncbi:MAG TPA: hypothetical protein VF507_09485, partial [Pyrinomonadaceae bacterium]
APPAPGTIKVDGVYGPVTQRWIWRYQEIERTKGNLVRVDGRIDRFNGRSRGALTGGVFSIVLLNFRFKIADPDNFPDVTDDPECPPELKLALGPVITS